MTQEISSQLIADYQRARARAHRFLRDSCPPLTKKGLAGRLALNVSAFNQFVNGTVFVSEAGQRVSPSQWDSSAEMRFGTNWTSRRLSRFIERVETECWNLGISHDFTSSETSAAKDDVENLRLEKYWQFLNDIKDAAELNISSALMLWNVCAQEAVDARQHLQPTMSVNALANLADILDRRDDGGFACVGLRDTPQQDRLEMTSVAVRDLIERVHENTGSPCVDSHDSKNYECFHKSLGYGGYDEFFLGLALDHEELLEDGVQKMQESVMCDHQVTDGHVANTATATEVALEFELPKAESWAEEFRSLIRQRLHASSNDPACSRLHDMQLPRMRAVWSGAATVAKAVTLVLIMMVVLSGRTSVAQDSGQEHVGAEGSRTQVPPSKVDAMAQCVAGEIGEVCQEYRTATVPVGTVVGDVNFDGMFDSRDMFEVLQIGEYEDAIEGNSTWEDGDWNNDLEFDSSDLSLAFKGMGAQDVAVLSAAVPTPEPNANLLLMLGGFGVLMARRNGKRS